MQRYLSAIRESRQVTKQENGFTAEKYLLCLTICFSFLAKDRFLSVRSLQSLPDLVEGTVAELWVSTGSTDSGRPLPKQVDSIMDADRISRSCVCREGVYDLWRGCPACLLRWKRCYRRGRIQEWRSFSASHHRSTQRSCRKDLRSYPCSQADVPLQKQTITWNH